MLIVCIYVGTFFVVDVSSHHFLCVFIVGFDCKSRVVLHFVHGINLLIVQ